MLDDLGGQNIDLLMVNNLFMVRKYLIKALVFLYSSLSLSLGVFFLNTPIRVKQAIEGELFTADNLNGVYPFRFIFICFVVETEAVHLTSRSCTVGISSGRCITFNGRFSLL